MNQQEVIESFELFTDWMEKYQYIIDLGKQLQPLDESDMVDENLLNGCQSNVWMTHEYKNEKITYNANSDAAIVSGLIALVLAVYSGKTPQRIVATEPEFIDHIGLSSHLSSTRSNGLHAMIENIKRIASQYIE